VPDVIVNTSPLQYLFQLGLLDLLPAFYGHVLVPEGVVREIQMGLDRGLSLPDLGSLAWLKIQPVGNRAVLPLVTGLGLGEREVLALALEAHDPLVVLDDAQARRFARRLKISLTGTLGLLLKAKQTGRLDLIRSALDRLERLGFRLDSGTRAGVMALAEEE
jgi:predicted nucleic acid-binding protein